MNRREFLAELEAGLTGLPQSDIDERVGFYSEMIADRMEEGLSEEEAVAEIGPVDEVTAQIVADTPLMTLVREKIKPARRMRPWEIVLIVLGFPVWFPLLAAAFAVALSLYAVLWALIVCLWAVWVALIACAAGGLAGGVLMIIKGETAKGLFLIGAAVVCAGLAILLFFGCRAATRGAAWLTKQTALWIKSLFVGKNTDRAKSAEGRN